MKIKSKSEVYMVAINATLGSFVFGYQMVNFSPIQRLFGNVNGYTQQQRQIRGSIITAVLPFMAIFGSLMIQKLMNLLLARKLMIILDIISIPLFFLQAYSLSFYNILLARLGIGFIVGVNSGLIPQYIYSVTPKSISASICSIHQLMLTIGIAVAYGLSFLIHHQNTEDQIAWRIIFLLPVIFSLTRCIILLFFLQYQIPSAKLKEKQKKRLQRYYYKVYEDYQSNSQRFSTISLDNSMQLQSNEKQLLSPSKKKALLVCITLALANQFCGINAILFYAKQLFMIITDNNNTLSQVLILLLGILQTVSAFFGGISTNYFNRKLLLILGLFLMAVFLGFIYIFENFEKVVILCIFLHTVAYSFSIGQLFMYFTAKMLVNTGYVMVVNWVLVFLIALSTQMFINKFGIGSMCLFFSIITSFCIIILCLYIPSDSQNDQQTLLNKEDSMKKQLLQLQSTYHDNQSIKQTVKI